MAKNGFWIGLGFAVGILLTYLAGKVVGKAFESGQQSNKTNQ